MSQLSKNESEQPLLEQQPILSEKEKKIQKYIHEGDVLNSNIFNRLFFYWAYKTIKVKIIYTSLQI